MAIRSLTAAIAVAILTVLALAETGPPVGPTPSPQVSTAASPSIQTAEEALPDLALVAQARGWTIDQAAAQHAAAEEVGAIAERIAAERPEIFIGSALSSEPDGPPALYVKGPADAFVRRLVADAGIEIRIVDNQPFSFEELEERSHRVHEALVALGFEEVTTGANITGGGTIPAAVLRTPGVTDDVAEILAALPSNLRDSVELTIHDAPIVVDEDPY